MKFQRLTQNDLLPIVYLMKMIGGCEGCCVASRKLHVCVEETGDRMFATEFGVVLRVPPLDQSAFREMFVFPPLIEAASRLVWGCRHVQNDIHDFLQYLKHHDNHGRLPEAMRQLAYAETIYENVYLRAAQILSSVVLYVLDGERGFAPHIHQAIDEAMIIQFFTRYRAKGNRSLMSAISCQYARWSENRRPSLFSTDEFDRKFKRIFQHSLSIEDGRNARISRYVYGIDFNFTQSENDTKFRDLVSEFITTQCFLGSQYECKPEHLNLHFQSFIQDSGLKAGEETFFEYCRDFLPDITEIKKRSSWRGIAINSDELSPARMGQKQKSLQILQANLQLSNMKENHEQAE